MVSSATSLGRSGLQDWLIQRVTAVLMAVYVFGLLAFWWQQAPLDFQAWQALFATTWMQIATFLALLSVVLHAWIGIWTVLTDYLKACWLRTALQLGVIIALLALLLWSAIILWG